MTADTFIKIGTAIPFVLTALFYYYTYKDYEKLPYASTRERFYAFLGIIILINMFAASYAPTTASFFKISIQKANIFVAFWIFNFCIIVAFIAFLIVFLTRKGKRKFSFINYVCFYSTIGDKQVYCRVLLFQDSGSLVVQFPSSSEKLSTTTLNKEDIQGKVHEIKSESDYIKKALNHFKNNYINV